MTTIQELLDNAVPDFQQSSDIKYYASPLVHLVRIKVNDPNATESRILTLDVNNKPVFTNNVSSSMIHKSLFFKITFQSLPGAQYDHCFIVSDRKTIAFIQNGNVLTEAITNGQVNAHNIQQFKYFFNHSPDGDSIDPPSNCSLHPSGTTASSLEFNSDYEAVMGSQGMKMNVEMLGHIDKGNNWSTTSY